MEKGLLLLSDGIDSPVAGNLMMKQGYHIDAIHFSMGNPIEKIQKLLKTLGKASKQDIKLFVVDHIRNQERFKETCNKRFQCILCKRAMHKIAQDLALKEGYDFLVNGENLGQVASQTLVNMKTIHDGLTIPVAQPLLARDKTETTDLAKEIGCYEISISEAHKCAYVPDQPVTRSTTEKILIEEEKAGMDGLIKTYSYEAHKITSNRLCRKSWTITCQ